MSNERLELRYVPLSQAKRWDENPKLHDLDALVRSIELHGFGDPPKYDATLDGLVYGNGRTEALERMRADGKEPPRGIAVLDDGDWAVPIIFGLDAPSHAAAVAFAVDHNNVTLLGANVDFTDLLGLWDEEGLQRILADVPDVADAMASFDAADLESLLAAPEFKPTSMEDQARLDEKKKVTCPECGHAFRPRD